MNAFEPVSFRNARGETLHGMLHAPAAEVRRGVCILLLSPGIKGRVGPHRLYLKLAGPFVAAGFHVLRFDYYGLGDSEGDARRARHGRHVQQHPGRPLCRGHDRRDGLDGAAPRHFALRRLRAVRRFDQRAADGAGGSAAWIRCSASACRARSRAALQNVDRFMTRGQLRREGQGYLRKILQARCLEAIPERQVGLRPDRARAQGAGAAHPGEARGDGRDRTRCPTMPIPLFAPRIPRDARGTPADPAQLQQR